MFVGIWFYFTVQSHLYLYVASKPILLNVFYLRIFIAEKPIKRFIFLNGCESSHRRIKSVIGIRI